MKYILFLVFFTAIPVQAQFVLSASDGLPDVGRSALVWADFNNDGRPDAAMTGVNSSGFKQAGVYFNNGDGSFSNSGAGIMAVSDGDMAVNDFDLDGTMDLLVTGVDAGNQKTATLYKNNGSGIFTALTSLLQGVSHGGVAFADMNNDGRPDILLNGINNSNQNVTLLYTNTGGQFELTPTSFAGTAYGDLLTLDVDNDSFLDVLVCGLNTNNQRVTKLYINHHPSFVERATVLPPLRSGAMAAADMNNDGFVDLFLSGSSSGTMNHAAIYSNNAGAGFVLVKSFTGVSEGGGAWGDYNRDGFADLMVWGFDKVNWTTDIFLNEGGTDFTDAAIPLPGMSQGMGAWVDHNQDQRLELSLTGYSSVPFTSLYTNNSTEANTLPSAPAQLTAVTYADSIVLSWDVAVDQETVSGGLTYSVSIGSASGRSDVWSPLADLNTGNRRVNGMSSLQRNMLVLPALPEGIYYWSVQAIDPAHGASPFSSEKTFVSCAPQYISGTDKVCLYSSLSLDAGDAGDDVKWYSLDKETQVGSGRHLEYVLSAKDTFAAVMTKPLGCVLYDTFTVDVHALPEVQAGDDQSSCIDRELTVHAITDEAVLTWLEEGSETVWSHEALATILVTRPMNLIAKVEDENGCLNTDTMSITLYPDPLVDLGSDRAACKGNDLQWTVENENVVVNWHSETNGLLLQNGSTVSLVATASDRIWAEVNSEHGCVSYDTVQVTVFELPVADAGEDQLICESGTATLGGLNPGSALAFSWTPAGSLHDAYASNPVASPQTNTMYVLTVVDANHCENKDTVTVYLNPQSVVDAGTNASICMGEYFTLGGTPTASGSPLPYTFSWTPSQGLDDPAKANPIAKPEATTTYTLSVRAGNCIVETATVTVEVLALPVISAGEDVFIGAKESVILSPSGGVIYHWFPEEFFSDVNSASPLVFPNRTTSYWVKGTDANGCSNIDTVKVSVRSELFVPSLFTPNQDGTNETFRAHGFGVREINLKIYDRWNRLLFESHDLEEGWDGRYNGSPVESGTYVWTIDGVFYDDTRLHFQGQQKGILKLVR